MADSEYERLRRRVEDGVQAADELKRLLTEAKREKRPKLRLIKGGMLVGAILAGVEWLREYRRAALAMVATGATVIGTAVFVDHERLRPPTAEPPAPALTFKPTAPRPSPHPPTETVATPTLTVPPRTSPLRTAVTKTPTTAPSPKPPVRAPARTTASPSDPPIQVLPTPTLPTSTEVVETADAITCTVDLLGVKLCLPRGRS